jgi:hypothetical protein
MPLAGEEEEKATTDDTDRTDKTRMKRERQEEGNHGWHGYERKGKGRVLRNLRAYVKLSK